MTALHQIHTRIIRPAAGTGPGRPLQDWAPLHDWSGAACRDHDPELWFPHPKQDSSAAEKICDQCPIRQACLDYARDNDEKNGVWGGSRRG